MSKGRVLIVDDSPFIHKAISRALAAGDFEVCGIGFNGKEGAELYAKLKPDVVTMDITMPEMDGIAAVKEIKTTYPDAKVVMVSAMGQQAMVIEAIRSGAADFIVKPFQPDRVLEALGKALS